MYSILKNTILKKLKYIIAGFLLITILPGNAGVKNYRASDTLEVPDRLSETYSDTINHYIQNTREISSTGKSINLVLNIK